MAKKKRRAIKGPFIDKLFKHFYPNNIEYNSVFFDWIEQSVDKDSEVLEVGAGAGLKWRYGFAELCKRVSGIDVDTRIKDNPNLTEFICSNFYDNEYPDNSFDIVFANSVMEHIEDPDRFLREVQRIIKPSGYFFMKAPNRWHYVSLSARLTPLWFHKFYCGLMGREPDDTFPTYYKFNSYRVIKRLCDRFGADFEFVSVETSPDYLFIEPLSFLAGVGYERLVNRYDVLKVFRNTIMVRLKFNKEEIRD